MKALEAATWSSCVAPSWTCWSSANFTPDNAKGPLHVQGVECRWMMYQGHLQQLSRKRTRKSGKIEHQIGWIDIWIHFNVVFSSHVFSCLLFYFEFTYRTDKAEKETAEKSLETAKAEAVFVLFCLFSLVWMTALVNTENHMTFLLDNYDVVAFLGRTCSVHDLQPAGWREGQTACRSHQRHSGTGTVLHANTSNC